MGNLMRKTEMIPIWYFGLFSKKKKKAMKRHYILVNRYLPT